MKVHHSLTYRMLARIGDKHLLEIWTANSQNDFVCPQQFSITGKCHVDQVATVVQVLKSTSNIVLEIVPAQSKLLHLDHFPNNLFKN